MMAILRCCLRAYPVTHGRVYAHGVDTRRNSLTQRQRVTPKPKVKNTHLRSSVDPTLLSPLPCYGPLTASHS